MSPEFDPTANYEHTRQTIGYVPRNQATDETYSALGFKSGLEIHQQLKTSKKLFCHCPCGPYQKADDYDAEVVRHMRPTLSEMGEYDGTALMERKTRKNIVYRLKYDTACTYEIDDTPPFHINMQAIDIAIELSLLLGLNVVGEIHITRKQYLDGSIPTGFQRTAIIGIEGEIPLSNRTVRILQLSLEEDSCREVSDIGHWRIYRTDRLGIPLSETVTYPDMRTPDEVAEAANYIRYLARSTGHVFTGIGAAREDVNVSINGGTRVEIKGVAHIRWIPELAHNEAFRQKALLNIRELLLAKIPDSRAWKITSADVDLSEILTRNEHLKAAHQSGRRMIAVNLPYFSGILSHFTQPGRSFADEIAGRLKVIACLEYPNMIHSEQMTAPLRPGDWQKIRSLLGAAAQDAQLLIWGLEDDIPTALETIEERCRMAFEGVPNETRKSLSDGTTVFERVLPGPNRMYPDTDSAPIPVEDEMIERFHKKLPRPVIARIQQFKEWQIPQQVLAYLLRKDFGMLIEKVQTDFAVSPLFLSVLLGQDLKNLEGKQAGNSALSHERLYELCAFVGGNKLQWEILRAMLPILVAHPNMNHESVLGAISYRSMTVEEILYNLPALDHKFNMIRTSSDTSAKARWIMGQLRPMALGNIPLRTLRNEIDRRITHDRSLQRL